MAEFAGKEQRFSEIRQQLREQGTFREVREVQYHGRRAKQWVAEVTVTLTRAAQRNRPNSKDRRRMPGPPLSLRLVIVEVCNDFDDVLAVWYLLTNVPEHVDTATIALWYYWRWQIEKYFKLLKSAGANAEMWQQDTAAAIARRLWIASLACMLVWQLARSSQPQASEARQFLVRLSGRQMKRKVPFTMPALLDGMWVLLAMLDALETYTVDQLRTFAEIALPHRRPPPTS